MKRLAALLLLCVLLTGCGPAVPEPAPGRLQIVAAVFPAYDFARAAVGDLADVSLLLPPGAESHSYEPTPADILRVQNCDLFIYLGGESDAWVDTILSAVEPKGQALRLTDCVELLEEEDHDHHDHQHGAGEVMEMDEHVWTSPANASRLTRTIGETLAGLDPVHEEAFRNNAEDYALQIDALDAEFDQFFQGLDSRTMVFGDRFPLRYFAEEFDLDYYAAFPGCGAQTEPSAATVALLTEKARGLPAVWYIEFSNHLVADSIAEAAGTQTAMFHTCHNVSRAELDAGATYLSLMQNNLATLREVMGGAD